MSHAFRKNEYRMLSPSEQYVFDAMLESSHECSCRELQTKISELSGVHLNTVKRAYKKMKELGIIIIRGHGNVMINPRFAMEDSKKPEAFSDLQRFFDEEASKTKAEEDASKKKWTDRERKELGQDV